jgi:hypothetical protein
MTPPTPFDQQRASGLFRGAAGKRHQGVEGHQATLRAAAMSGDSGAA